MSTADRRFEFACNWLLSITVASGVMGVLLMVPPPLALLDWYEGTWARAFYAAPVLPPEAARVYDFALALVGAGVIGWVVTLAFVIAIPFRRRERWAFHAVAIAVVVWVVLDLAAALWFGVTGEVAFAAFAGLGFAAPLALAWPGFQANSAGSGT